MMVGFIKISLLFLTLNASKIVSFKLTILHTNDVHARFEEASKYGGPCTADDASDRRCFGGVARRATLLRDLRTRFPDSVLLDAGDQYQGTLWFYEYKGKAASYFMNILQYDAMAFGNHEFDLGIDGIIPFLDNVTFPVLACNIDASQESGLRSKFNKSVVLRRGGEDIGIVGYVTTDTPQLTTNTGNLLFDDEVSSIQKEVDELTRRGVHKIIALGHAGHGVDKLIASRVRGVDIVVGGHTNTFLYNGSPPSNEKPVDSYPVQVTSPGSSTVLVVQDYAFGKYLGFLQVDFNNDGQVVSWNGNPILLNSSIEQDPNVLSEIVRWRENLDHLSNKTIGRTHVFLDGRREVCRVQECNLGNMLADACVRRNLNHPDGLSWSNVSIALINSGSIRTSIRPGAITVADVLAVWPFRNNMDIVELRGRTLRRVLEHSVTGHSTVIRPGHFLQVSGLLVKYDLTRPEGQRVVSVEVKCTRCSVPEYRALDDEAVYQVIASDYLVNGGDGYAMIKQDMLKHHMLGDLDTDIMMEYIAAYSPIVAGLERRIQFTSGGSHITSSTPKPSHSFLLKSMFLFHLVYMLHTNFECLT